MVLTVTSPYNDDETRTKGIEQLLEDYIEYDWDVPGIPSTDVKFGQKGTRILQSGKSITLRCYVYSSIPTRMDVSGQRWSFRDAVLIDIYVQNNNSVISGRDPRAIKILTFLKDLFMINQGKLGKGVFQADLISASITDDPIKDNLTHVMVRVGIEYIYDIVDVP